MNPITKHIKSGNINIACFLSLSTFERLTVIGKRGTGFLKEETLNVLSKKEWRLAAVLNAAN